MLFRVKNYLLPTLLLWLIFSAGSLLARRALGLEWNLSLQPETWRRVLMGLALVACSDVLLQGFLWLILRKRYLLAYSELVRFFSPQGLPEIVAGGLLATSEEWLFRGIVLQVVMMNQGSAAAGVAVSALLFGLCHLLRRPPLTYFVFWAVWEGVLLGLVYLISGSLLVAMCVHGVHDIAGFLLFARQRRTGWLMVAE